MNIPITNYPASRPYSNVQPFTVRDGATYLLQIETLLNWIREDLVPHINSEVGGLADSWATQTLELIENWETQATALVNTVNDAVSGVQDLSDIIVVAKNEAEAARDLAEQFASDAVAMQDASVSQIFDDAESTLRTHIEQAFTTKAEHGALQNTVADVSTELDTGRLSETALSATIDGRSVVVNVRNYGAVGDGVTDDSPAIASAIAACPVSGFTLTFPDGEYIHDGILITGRNNFRVEGPGRLVMRSDLIPGGNYFQITASSKFVISGLTSRHELDTPDRALGRGFNIFECSDFTLENLEAHHTESIGIMVQDSTDGTVTGCYVHDTSADGIGVYGECLRIAVVGNRLRNTADDAIATVGVVGVDTGPPRLITISGNVIDGSQIAHCIVVAGGEDVAISGNSMDNSSAGAIYVESGGSRDLMPCRRVTITGNTIRRANQNNPTINQGAINILGSVSAPVEDVTISGNVITEARYRAIAIGRSGSDAGSTARVIVTGNEVYNSDGAALYAQNVEDLTITGNAFIDAPDSGIYLSSDVRGSLLIVGNTLKNCGTGGIQSGLHALSIPNVTYGLVAANIVDCPDALYATDLAGILANFGNVVNGGVRGGSSASQIRGSLGVSAAAANPATGGGEGVIAVRNAKTTPSTNPGNGGVIYVEGGSLKFLGSSGTVTTVAPA